MRGVQLLIAHTVVLAIIAVSAVAHGSGGQIGEPQGHVKVNMPPGEGSTVKVAKCRTRSACSVKYVITPRGHGVWRLRRTR